ncbi:MAG TPA: DUF2663 family protein [Massilibacterium sp.]|nr:DUF2663 family protein [Massilibacterium sp.]
MKNERNFTVSEPLLDVIIHECVKRKRVVEKRRKTLHVVGVIALMLLCWFSYQVFLNVWTFERFFYLLIPLAFVMIVFLFQSYLFQESKEKYEGLCEYMREYPDDLFKTKKQKEDVYHHLLKTYDINLYYP